MRNVPMVDAWIRHYYGNMITPREPPSPCHHCGWPHNEQILCGMGATFGSVRLGGQTYYIDASNVEFMQHFMKNELGPGFHWKNEVFFRVDGDSVIVSRVEGYNGNPNIKRWTIPLNEWRSIVDSVESVLRSGSIVRIAHQSEDLSEYDKFVPPDENA